MFYVWIIEIFLYCVCPWNHFKDIIFFVKKNTAANVDAK